IVYFGEEVQDLGVFALRTISQDTIASGSALNFVSAIQSSSTAENPVGIIIANMGQLLWYRRGKRAVTRATWAGLPRKTGVSQQLTVDSVKNRVPGNEDVAAHTKYIFEYVIPRMVNPAAKLNIIGIGEGAEETVNYLQYSWETWKDRIQAIVIGSGYQWPSSDIQNPEFADFWGKRARAYLLSAEPVETPLSGREGFGCNCYSSGEEFFTERLIIEAYTSILRYFSLVDKVPGYQELPIIIPQGSHEDTEGEEWGGAVSWGDEVKDSADADADAAGTFAVTSAKSVAAGAAAAAEEKSEEKKITEIEEELVKK
ncbi:hypothetical protein MMC31_002243, partial [Peltigera leucophlebia]|nr:hypothetical protein [Peltigera leucophlebia]